MSDHLFGATNVNWSLTRAHRCGFCFTQTGRPLHVCCLFAFMLPKLVDPNTSRSGRDLEGVWWCFFSFFFRFYFTQTSRPEHFPMWSWSRGWQVTFFFFRFYFTRTGRPLRRVLFVLPDLVALSGAFMLPNLVDPNTSGRFRFTRTGRPLRRVFFCFTQTGRPLHVWFLFAFWLP